MTWLVLLTVQAAWILNGSGAASARCVTMAESDSARVAPRRLIAPGPPPILTFRYYEGRMHHRYGNLDLVLDDAGH
jgi:hypothetical protein